MRERDSARRGAERGGNGGHVQMSDAEKAREERDEPKLARGDADEKLEDLEPGEGEGAAVKGGGGSTQNQTGSEPEDLR